MADEPVQEYIKTTYTKPRPYRWAAGEYLSRLYRECRDNKRLMTVKCQHCNEHVWPPSKVCGRCKKPSGDNWVVIPDKGTVVQFTYTNFPMFDPHEGKYMTETHPFATIDLDDCEVFWVAKLEEKDKDKLKPGMRVQAVWREEGRGGGLDHDILYFRTIED